MSLSPAVVIGYAALIGLCVGSFLNVIVWRVPQGLSLRQPPSHCPSCSNALAWRHNIPVLSWLLLRRRCHFCSAPISARYPLVEAGCAALFALVVWARSGPEAVAYCLAGAGMLALSIIDLEHYRLPNRVLGPTALLTLAAFTMASLVEGDLGALGRSLLGALIGLASLGLIHVAQPQGMGFGDVKLAGLCGLLLGWRGLSYVPVGLFLAFMLGAVVGLALLLGGRVGRKARIPFGPFLCLSSLGVALAGDPLVQALGRLILRR